MYTTKESFLRERYLRKQGRETRGKMEKIYRASVVTVIYFNARQKALADQAPRLNRMMIIASGDVSETRMTSEFFWAVVD